MNLMLTNTDAFAATAVLALLITGVAIYLFIKSVRSERQLLSANKRYVDLINNIQGGVITCVFDLKTNTSRTLYINEGWTALTGYTLEDLNETMGGNPQALVLPDDREAANRDYSRQIATGNTYQLQYRVCCKDGSIIWAIDRGVVTTDAHGNPQNQSIITEVTEIKKKEEELLRLSQTDPLTGLYNKTSISALATERLDGLDGQHDRQHALMMLDIDNFKGINDSLGHIFGDTVLIEVSARLRQLLRPQDLIGRVGGDEFMVLMTDLTSAEDAQKKADAICATFRNTYTGENCSYKISCSMGIVYSTDGSSLKDLLSKADIAMYRAKAMGKDRWLVYNSSENDEPTACYRPAAAIEQKAFL